MHEGKFLMFSYKIGLCDTKECIFMTEMNVVSGLFEDILGPKVFDGLS